MAELDSVLVEWGSMSDGDLLNIRTKNPMTRAHSKEDQSVRRSLYKKIVTNSTIMR
jgi:hypothetical protein